MILEGAGMAVRRLVFLMKNNDEHVLLRYRNYNSSDRKIVPDQNILPQRKKGGKKRQFFNIQIHHINAGSHSSRTTGGVVRKTRLATSAQKSHHHGMLWRHRTLAWRYSVSALPTTMSYRTKKEKFQSKHTEDSEKFLRGACAPQPPASRGYAPAAHRGAKQRGRRKDRRRRNKQQLKPACQSEFLARGIPFIRTFGSGDVLNKS